MRKIGQLFLMQFRCTHTMELSHQFEIGFRLHSVTSYVFSSSSVKMIYHKMMKYQAEKN